MPRRGLACTWYFRRVLTRNAVTLIFAGIVPFLSGLFLFWVGYQVVSQGQQAGGWSSVLPVLLCCADGRHDGPPGGRQMGADGSRKAAVSVRSDMVDGLAALTLRSTMLSVTVIPALGGKIISVRRLAAVAAQYAPFPDSLDERLKAALNAREMR